MKETEVTIGGKDNLSGITKVSNLSEVGPKLPEEDVDGKDAARALQSLQRLAFLKIFVIDIGLSLGDVVTDMVQGLSLIYEADWSLSTTTNYGILVLATCWLPGPLVLLHLCLHNKGLKWSPYGVVPSILLSLLCLLLFPLLPTILYVAVLISQDPFQWERKAREVKAIAGVTESPLQVVILGFLMLKGVLVFPWNKEVSSTCIEDELGRRLCLPSIPMVSLAFSLASILKAMFDMNLNPLTKNMPHQISASLVLSNTPFYLSNVIFRCHHDILINLTIIIPFTGFARMPSLLHFLTCGV